MVDLKNKGSRHKLIFKKLSLNLLNISNVIKTKMQSQTLTEKRKEWIQRDQRSDRTSDLETWHFQKLLHKDMFWLKVLKVDFLLFPQSSLLFNSTESALKLYKCSLKDVSVLQTVASSSQQVLRRGRWCLQLGDRNTSCSPDRPFLRHKPALSSVMKLCDCLSHSARWGLIRPDGK